MLSTLHSGKTAERHRLLARGAVYLLLGLVAFWVNQFSVRLSTGSDILFSSIFVVLAAVLGGVPAAAFVSLCGGLRTYLIWNHPYAIPVMVLEGIWVGYFARRDRTPVATVVVYWPLIGIPLVLALYRWHLHLSLEFVWMIALADVLAGILGAIIVHLFSTIPGLRRYAQLLDFPLPAYSLRSHIWVSALLFGILPLLILLEYAGGELNQSREKESLARLTQVAESVDNLFRAARVPDARLYSLRHDPGGAFHLTWAPHDAPGGSGQLVEKSLNAPGATLLPPSIPLLRVLCYSSDGTLLFAQPADRAPGPDTASRIFAASRDQKSFEFRGISRVGALPSRYLAGSSDNKVGGYTIIATQPATFAGSESRTLAKVALVWLTGTILLSLVLGAWFSIRFTRSLQNLIGAMQSSLGADGTIGDCPPDAASEVSILWQGFRLLQDKLSAAVQLHQIDARKAIAAVAEKNAFMASVSHELRGPMNSISGATALMVPREGAAPAIPVEEATAMIARASRHLMSIIDDVSDFSRLESHSLPLRPSAFPLAAALADIVDWVHAEARRKQVEIGVFLGAGIPLIVFTDRTRFSQILHNLLHNAVKFTDFGEIRICVEIPAAAPDQLEFRVEDSGDGIDPELHASVFEPFFHRSSSTATPRAGSGLGLAIVKRLVDQMGGSVSLQSTPGLGTRVTVRLPLVPSPDASQAPPGIFSDAIFCMGLSLSRDSLISQWHNLGGTSRVAVFDTANIPPITTRSRTALFLDIEEIPASPLEIQELFATVLALGYSDLFLVEAFSHPNPLPAPANSHHGLVIHWLPWPPVLYKSPSVLRALPSATGQASSRQAPAPASSRPLNILIADDDADCRLLLQLALSQFGHTVTAVPHGGAALETLRAKTFDAVLLDIEMPVLGGNELIRILRANPATASIPVYAVTAHASEHYRNEYVADGFTGHLAKPYTLAELQSVLLGVPLPASAAQDSAQVVNATIFNQFAGLLAASGKPAEPSVTRILSEVRAWIQSASQPPPNLRTTIHPYVGSCSLIGAAALAASLRDLSARGDSLSSEEWANALSQITGVLDDSQRAFDELLAGLPAV